MTRPPSEYQLWLDASRDAAPLATRCAVDGCSWTHRGTAGAGREAAREHRRLEHPELPLVAVRPKPIVRPKPRATQPKPRPVVEPKPRAERPPRAVRAAPRPRPRLTDDRVAAAATVYARGYTLREIGEVAAPLWGYSSVKSAAVSLNTALRTAGAPLRRRGERIPTTIPPAEAERILRAADAAV